MIPVETIFYAKIIVAAVGLSVLFFWKKLATCAGSSRFEHLPKRIIITAGLLSAMLWYGPVLLSSTAGKPGEHRLSAASYLHVHDLYHYYMGAKYFAEIGYTGLYESAVIANYENGNRQESLGMVIRSSRTKNNVAAKNAIAAERVFKSRFTPERWQAFKADVDYFRQLAYRHAPDSWSQMNADHGFNPSPAWSLLGSTITNTTGAATDAKLVLISIIDVLLMLATAAAVGRTFGWLPLSVLLIFIGTNIPADIGWTSPSLLRFDWFFLLITGICLLKQDRPVLAGVCIAYASLLRAFPALILLGLLAKELSGIAGGRLRPSRETKRLIAGCVIAAAVLVPMSTYSSNRGWPVWGEFHENLNTLMSHPASNYVGLKTLLWIKPWEPTLQKEGDTVQSLKDAYIRIVWNPKTVVFLIAGFYFVFLSRFAGTIPHWRAAVLGLGFIPILGDLSCYYYIFMAGYGLLTRHNPRIGAALCAVSLITLLLFFLTTFTKIYYWTSFYVIVFVLVAAVLERSAASSTQ